MSTNCMWNILESLDSWRAGAHKLLPHFSFTSSKKLTSKTKKVKNIRHKTFHGRVGAGGGRAGGGGGWWYGRWYGNQRPILHDWTFGTLPPTPPNIVWYLDLSSPMSKLLCLNFQWDNTFKLFQTRLSCRDFFFFSLVRGNALSKNKN